VRLPTIQLDWAEKTPVTASRYRDMKFKTLSILSLVQLMLITPRGLEGRPLYIYICHPKRGMARCDKGFVSKILKYKDLKGVPIDSRVPPTIRVVTP
jgi:hypothetical protein